MTTEGLETTGPVWAEVPGRPGRKLLHCRVEQGSRNRGELLIEINRRFFLSGTNAIYRTTLDGKRGVLVIFNPGFDIKQIREIWPELAAALDESAEHLEQQAAGSD